MVPPKFKEEIKGLRSKYRLHGKMAIALREAISSLFPDWAYVPEVAQTPGGRNDAVLFQSNGKSICFELFASKSQVDRDLMLLYESPAQHKIAVIIDREIDPSVSLAYYRKFPRAPFPVIWLSKVMLPENRRLLQIDLMRLILGSKTAEALHIADQLLRTAPERTFRQWQSKGIEIFAGPPDVPNHRSVFTLLVASKIRRLGLPWGAVEGAAKIVNECWDFILSKISLGVPLFLVTHSGSSAWNLLDLGDYQGVFVGGLLMREGDHIAVLVNSAYDELRKLHSGPLPDPGDMKPFIDLYFGRQSFSTLSRSPKPRPPSGASSRIPPRARGKRKTSV